MRMWNILEQTVEDPATKLRLEFSSIHTDEVQNGNEAPGNDETVLLRLWTSDRARVATFKFQRNGAFLMTEVDLPVAPLDTPLPPEIGAAPADGPLIEPITIYEPVVLGMGGAQGDSLPKGGAPVDPVELWKEDPEMAAKLGLAVPPDFS